MAYTNNPIIPTILFIALFTSGQLFAYREHGCEPTPIQNRGYFRVLLHGLRRIHVQGPRNLNEKMPFELLADQYEKLVTDNAPRANEALATAYFCIYGKKRTEAAFTFVNERLPNNFEAYTGKRLKNCVEGNGGRRMTWKQYRTEYNAAQSNQ